MELSQQYSEVTAYMTQATEVPTPEQREPYYEVDRKHGELSRLVSTRRGQPFPLAPNMAELWEGSEKELTALIATDTAAFIKVQQAFALFLKGNKKPVEIVSEEDQKIRASWMGRPLAQTA